MNGRVADSAGGGAGFGQPQGGEVLPGRRLTPLRIAALYAIVGAIWIVFSDRVLAALVQDATLQLRLQTVKGWFFVLTTAGLLYLLVTRLVAELRQRDERIRATVESMPDAVLVVDAEGQVVEVNRAAVQLLGATGEAQLLGPMTALAERFKLRRSDGSPFHPGDFASMRALRGETLRGYEAMIRRPDGRDVYVGVTASPVQRRAGERPRLAVAVVRDMSELRRFEEMREEFLATAAHEFKTPLAVIKAQAQLLQRRGEADPQGLQVLNRQVERLSRLTHQLLELSRLRLGGPELRRETYDLGEQVADVLERLQALAAGHRLSLSSREPAPVYADRERIEQVLVNLVDNAVKFSPGGCDVEASVARLGSEVQVSVRDQGVGIPHDKQSRVFERYYRAHAGTPEDYGGIGVGLDMSREIVSRHGGRMWFESEPGTGSIFCFTLPLAEGAAHA
ncbi:MAG TPA: PAS domain-containing sensor histidine kinase [Anaeromyxobacteraceae bacterium]|nr:PAS domain-containing sensor histidine kinase [Anaeromyxobacteraceae bacterium]